MGTVRNDHSLSFILVLVLCVTSAVWAAAGDAGLYDQPVLTLDAGAHRDDHEC
jgi:hypothetical protein